jgi:GNAT superfamily N-acetyltransferase
LSTDGEAARRAGDADVARVVELAELLVAELEPMRGGALWAATRGPVHPLAEHYAARVAALDALLLVGTIDEVVVGYASSRVDELRDGTRLAVVDEVYVEPEARAVGVGECLLDAVVAWAGEQRCTGVDAVALPGHRQAKNFFEAHGFTARLLVMHHVLPDGGEHPGA